MNGALFYQTDPRPTGTGYIDPFLRLGTGTNNYEQGYNTSARPFQYDQKEPLNYTHDLMLGAVPIVSKNGVDYREFLLDINQINSGTGALLSLDVLQIFLRSSAFTDSDITHQGNNYTFPSLGTMVWNLDDGVDSYIKLNYDLNTGSGSGDMLFYVPNSLFAGYADTTALYLFSGFGTNYEANDGFEEWWVGKSAPVPPVPEPGTMILLGAGFLSLAIYGKRRRNNA
ncbi:PEP-CTERM sorting domain-containing protein [Geomonas diazotrophica]|uniref:PEP-CTERM sorting domain-containing protein n=1 Tax=Geomonas diazotrophica TaxID=2843197 RepID=UPI001EF13FD2|nr:PEP-CTERM sorting domain-containing protein [Geomonas nitrogeniifigens]